MISRPRFWRGRVPSRTAPASGQWLYACFVRGCYTCAPGRAERLVRILRLVPHCRLVSAENLATGYRNLGCAV